MNADTNIKKFRDGDYSAQACTQCGCTNDNACHDPSTGTCFWVKEDLCSMCAAPEERQEALSEIEEFWNLELED